MTTPAFDPPPGWLPKAEYDAIYRRVPRLCVEVVLATRSRGVLLALRDIPPNVGAWHIPGGTVLFGESLLDAVARVARMELGLEVRAGELLGTIEYPSHYTNSLDSPVGLAYACQPADADVALSHLPDGCRCFRELPDGLYAEQRAFLTQHLGYLR
jgi:ADP-ribose pyrophosphatase YjhB (NUDIX family)